MEDSLMVNINTICRCCLAQNRNDMKYFFEENRLQLFCSITSLNIIKSDGLSTNICNECIKKLDFCYSFKEMCIKNYKKLIEYSKSLKDMSNMDLKQEKIHSDELENGDLSDSAAIIENEISIGSGVDDIFTGITDSFYPETAIKLEETEHIEKIKISELTVQLEDNNHSTGPTACTLCSRTFDHPRYLKNHMRSHSSPQYFQCDICSKICRKKVDLKRHMVKHSGEKLFPCKICHKHFSRAFTMNQHMKIHSNERPHSCTICDKRFLQLISLKQHVRIHTGIKPYLCSICSRNFTQLGNLKLHMLTHSGERSHACLICEKTFIQRQNLKEHMKTHNTDRLCIPCKLCGKEFLSGYGLRRHMPTHTGIKPYACDLCSKRFYFTDQLKRHRITHTGERPFICPVCSKCLTRADHLKTHMQKHGELNIKNS